MLCCERPLIRLCERPCFDAHDAERRLTQWENRFPTGSTPMKIRRELFRTRSIDGASCLHLVMEWEKCEVYRSEYGWRLADSLLYRYHGMRKHPRTTAIFMAQPKNGLPILHVCAQQANIPPRLFRMVIQICPEAMYLPVTYEGSCDRTPLDFLDGQCSNLEGILKTSLRSYLYDRVRICVYLCVTKLFLRKKTRWKIRPRRAWIPFDDVDRRKAGLTPRSWFIASVLGYILQREMKDIALLILSYARCDAMPG